MCSTLLILFPVAFSDRYCVLLRLQLRHHSHLRCSLEIAPFVPHYIASLIPAVRFSPGLLQSPMGPLLRLAFYALESLQSHSKNTLTLAGSLSMLIFLTSPFPPTVHPLTSHLYIFIVLLRRAIEL